VGLIASGVYGVGASSQYIPSGVYGVGASMTVEYTELVLTADVPFYALLALLLTGFAWHLNIPEMN